MTPKVVLAAGAFRSGSTWLYNAIRLVLQSHGVPFAAGWVDDLAKDTGAGREYLLVKLHEPSDEWAGRAWRVFTSHRDPRDVAASAADFLKLTDTADLLRSVERAVGDHAYWSTRAQYDMAYEAMRGDPAAVLAAIAEVLGFPLEAGELARIAADLEAIPEPRDAAKYDSTSLLHPVHRFDGAPGGWARRLAPAQAAEIAARYGEWMARHGYLP